MMRKSLPVAPVQRFVRLRLRVREFSVSISVPFDNVEASVQDFLAILKVDGDQPFVVTTESVAAALEPLGTGWQIKRRGTVAFEYREVENLKGSQPRKYLVHADNAEGQTDLIRNDCSGVRDKLLDEAVMSLFVHGKRSNRTKYYAQRLGISI